jgi:L-lactate dehydrogenase complex protein LldE
VLERLGYEVRVPDGLTCCGQPAFNAGFHDEARAAARQTLNALEATDGPIVIPSGSCGDMLIHQYDALFADDRDDCRWRESARRVAARCREFSVFVAGHDVAALRLACPTPTRVHYHPSCHLLRGLGVRDEPRALIDAVHGATLADGAAFDECCGFGGLFSVKHGDISTRMLERKLEDVAASGADRLVSCDLGCLLHLGGGLHRRQSEVKVQHLSELLDEALP